ncbi:helix-turn-helix domain-containing protein [Mucilaginibacter sp. SG564]|uniref:helix-turn-helix domain-containing protein n=1 Tax=Mucilaginibacter sp. SG564 TaxID=2587022 RepID=UPI0015535EB9|nr:helix-turn-helix domain-containing protein [Mucilaginibacter sp. SG564]NOW95945.1 AraC-like DNA-binding protein [Mucilaginibacter sp. SG564]
MDNRKEYYYCKYLLSFTDYSIKEIANIPKFADQAHFSNYFKRYTSYSPTYYRNHQCSIEIRFKDDL